MLLYFGRGYETEGREERKEGRKERGTERERARGEVRSASLGKEGAWVEAEGRKVVRTSSFVLRDIGDEDCDREAGDQSDLGVRNEG